jgi:glycosyltransferase involved in cell wall biosynthesis
MRVCYVVSTFPRYEGDPEVTWMQEKVRCLKRRGVDVTIFAPSFKGLGSHYFEGIPVHRFRYFFKPWERLTHNEGATNKIQRSPLYAALALFYIIFGSIAMLRHCAVHRYDIFHAHWPFPHALFAWIGARLQRATFCLRFYGAELVLSDRFPPAKPFLRFFMRRADGMDSNSSFSKAKAEAPLPGCMVTPIPDGAPIHVDPSMLPSLRPTDPARSGPKRLFFMARLIERKGAEYLVRAMPQVRSRVPDVQLVLAGGGHRSVEIEQAIREGNLEDCVTMAGRISDEERDRNYAECDIFVLPAVVDKGGDTEMLGVVFLESMANRKPVIASSVGGIPDAVVHEETGLLVPERDSAALADAIVRVLTEPGLAERLGEGGYRRVQEFFSWDRIVNQSLDAYADAQRAASLKRRKRSHPHDVS